MAVKTMTTASIAWHNWGDCAAVSGDVATITDGDTLVSPFGLVHNVIFTPTTSVVVVPTFSGRTITFKVASGTPSGRLTVIGR